MYKLLTGLLILIAILIVLAPQPSTSAQSDEPILLPRFGEDGAIIQDPTSGIHFTARMTPDHNYVIGINTMQTNAAFIWDISDLDATDQITSPDPVSIDLTAFPSSGFSTLALQNTQYAIIRLGNHLVQIDMPAKSITQSVQIEDRAGECCGGIAIQGDTVAVINDTIENEVVLWNTATDIRSAHNFEDELSLISPFRDGWLISSYRNEDTNIDAHYFCDLGLDHCIREIIPGGLGVEVDGVLVFGQLSPFAADESVQTTYYTFDFENGLVPTESIFPFLPIGAIPRSVSPDGKYMCVLTPVTDETIPDIPSYATPTRISYMWEIEGQQRSNRCDGTWKWFGEHFMVVSGSTLRSADSATRLDWLRPPFRLPFVPHGIGLFQQLSDDGTHVLIINGGGRFVLPIEYQRVDDLLQVDETIFSMERGDMLHTQLSSDGRWLLGIEGNTLMARDIHSGDMLSLDLSNYLEEESVIELFVRVDDAFLQIDNHLLRLNLADLSIVDEISVNDTLTDVPVWAYLIQDEPSIAQNGDTIAALFDNTTVLWENGEFRQIDIGGIRLHSRTNGWAIHRIVVDDNFQHQLTFCDMTLTDCHTYPFDDTFATFYGENGIVGGSTILIGGADIEPTYWEIDDTITPTEPFIDLPAYHVLVDVHGDYAVVAAPSIYPAGETSARQYQTWSIANQQAVVPRFTFESRRWLWVGDYWLLAADYRLTIVHLPDGRYTHWTAASTILRLDISADGSHLLVTSRNNIHILQLTE